MKAGANKESHMNKIFYLVLFTLASQLLSSSVHSEIDTSPSAAEIRKFSSCSAYAFIRTADFPATVKLRQKGGDTLTDLEKKEADEGLKWVLRGFFADKMTAQSWRELYKVRPTNGDISSSKADWVKLLNDASPLQREAIGSNCRPLFQHADKYCNKKKCISYDKQGRPKLALPKSLENQLTKDGTHE